MSVTVKTMQRLSFLDMEGSFSMELDGERKAYTFRSESGDSLCDFEEEN